MCPTTKAYPAPQRDGTVMAKRGRGRIEREREREREKKEIETIWRWKQWGHVLKGEKERDGNGES